MEKVYCSDISDPYLRASIKEDILAPLSKLPDVVEEKIKNYGTSDSFILKVLTKEQLAALEKKCTEELFLERGATNILLILRKIIPQIKETISEMNYSHLKKLKSWTKSRLIEKIAQDIWQNIYHALIDDPELRHLWRFLCK